MIKRVILFCLTGATLALADVPRHCTFVTIAAFCESNRLAQVTNLEQEYWTGFDLQASYAYDAVGNLAELDYIPGGWVHRYDYDAENRLIYIGQTNRDDGEMQGYQYSLDATGARTNVIEMAWPFAETNAAVVRQVRYDYDRSYSGGAGPARVHRLSRETILDAGGNVLGAITNTYDAAGNRLARQAGFNFTPSDSMANQSFLFDHRDLIDSDAAPNNANPNYDANGNTVIDNGTNTGDLYDAENHLIARGSAIQITYDADGNRVSKTVNGTTTYYLVDDLNPTGYPQVLAEYNSVAASVEPTVSYTYGLQLVNEQWSGNVTYYETDGQGSVRFMTGPGGLQWDAYDYDAFGMLLDTASGDPNNYLYASQQWDLDLGMYYNRARYYKPNLGRFWTMDTYEGDNQDPLSLHKYLYCQANPINHIDPSGRDVGDLMMTMAIGANIGAMANVATAYAKGQAITTMTIVQGAALGAFLGPFAVGAPVVAGVGGAIYSYGTFAPVLIDNNATCSQKIVASAMIVAGFWGAQAGMNYNSLETRVALPSGNANPPVVADAVPDFPLPFRAPLGITLKSLQPGLSSDKVWQIPELINSMQAGKSIPNIGGYKSGNVYYINEGNHRIAAALELFDTTGNSGPLMQLLQGGNWDLATPSAQTWNMTKN